MQIHRHYPKEIALDDRGSYLAAGEHARFGMRRRGTSLSYAGTQSAARLLKPVVLNRKTIIASHGAHERLRSNLS